MNHSDSQDKVKSKHKIASRFRNMNIIFYTFATLVIIAVMIVSLGNVISTVSADYAELYSTSTSGSLSIHLNKEIALVGKTARSDAIVNWYLDEMDLEKKNLALIEMLETIEGLFSDNMYLGLEESWNEYAIQGDMGFEEMEPHGVLKPDYFDDAWYFECMESPNDYVLNVDVDKVMKRKRVWVNHKVYSGDVPIGILCTGLEFAYAAENLLAEYDNAKVRGVIIDENGIIQMDSKSLGDSEFLLYEQTNYIESEITDPVFLEALEKHLESIDGFFDTYNPTVIKMKRGQYSYATITPIEFTNWAVITFYDSSSLVNVKQLIPLYILILVLFICFIISISVMGYRLLFKPFHLIMESLDKVRADKKERLYGLEREDEFGDLSRNVQDMIDRIASYSTDLEKEVEIRSADLKLAYEQVHKQHEVILSSIDYASKIQRNLLPKESVLEEAFADYSVIWEPKDVVGGDIYWQKNFEDGTLLCVCDCTGHGTPGALLTMLVVSAFETVVDTENYKDPARIIWELDRRLVSILQVDMEAQTGKRVCSLDISDGCDLAVLFIATDGTVTLSSGNTNVFICNTKEVRRIKGQKIFVGEGCLQSKDEVEIITIPADPENKFYIASDGLFDQMGGNPDTPRPLGYRKFMNIIFENQHETQKVITEMVWDMFEEYRGKEIRRDDVELIAFQPIKEANT